MRYLLTSSVTLFLSSPVLAEDTTLAQATNAVRPAVEAATNHTQKSILQTWAGGKGPLADGAKRVLASIEHQERIDNRGPRRSMRECIKPNSVIDDDVKECMDGLREKGW
ncbi:hypothetical protein [Pseudomonas oryzihabitans]|uniref:UrcA family protein n=1 Tax=Pseudomonas oryzihabitans TaxID=47885 RepID=A0AAJ2EZ66_9PSED|nr:hypothetical protein [Pseudomonas psychrotolerans]MDR6234030.1 hypothetical protein [Pseudomonas psychrotolerans]